MRPDSFKRPAFSVAFFAIGFLLLLLPFTGRIDPPVALLIFGRLHPLVLHFPIVLVTVLLLLEVAARLGLLDVPRRLLWAGMATAGVSTIVAVAAGFFLFASGDYSGNLIQAHFWGACVSGALLLFSGGVSVVAGENKLWQNVYLTLLALSAGCISIASHLGGSVTHGENYLTEYVPLLFADGEPAQKPSGELLVYSDMIGPVFQAKCMSCHNETRAKGRYVMSSLSALTKAGNSGNAPLAPTDGE